MRKLIIALSLLSLNIYAQDSLLHVAPAKNGLLTYTGVVQVESTNQEELYNRAKRWIVQTTKPIDLDDFKNGEVISSNHFLNTFTVLGSTININVWHSIKIQVKDRRYKFVITSFRVKYFVPAGQYTAATNVDVPIEGFFENLENQKAKLYKSINESIDKMTKELETYMKSKPDDKW